MMNTGTRGQILQCAGIGISAFLGMIMAGIALLGVLDSRLTEREAKVSQQIAVLEVQQRASDLKISSNELSAAAARLEVREDLRALNKKIDDLSAAMRSR